MEYRLEVPLKLPLEEKRMAMNKSEKQQFGDLENALRVAKAFKFTERVSPDIPVPNRGDVYGFTYHAYKSVRVERSVSSSCSHGSTLGSDTPKVTTQRGIPQYSSRLLALRAGRHELEQEFAAILAGVDAQIEQELSKRRQEPSVNPSAEDGESK